MDPVFALSLSGNYTVVIETICCIFFLYRYIGGEADRRFALRSSFLFAVLIGLQQIPLGNVHIQLLQMHMAILLFLNIIAIGLFKLIPMYLYIYFGTGKKRNDSVFVFAQAFTGSELIRAMVWTLYVTIRQLSGNESKLLEILSIMLMIALSIPLLGKVYPNPEKADYNQNISGKLAVFSLAISYISFIVGNIWSWIFFGSYISMTSLIFYAMQFLMITIYLSGMLGLYLMQHLNYEMQMQRDLQATSDMLNLRYQQYLDYVKNSEYIAKQSHDLKHVIAGMRSTPGAEQWSDYLDEMDQAVKKYSTWNVSGNSVLDAILTQKKQYCNEHNIQLTCNADGKAFEFMSVKDICALFGNILDNAIEAVMPLEGSDVRAIQGEIAEKNHFLLIRFENPCEAGVKLENGELPQTSKQDKDRHGYGLKSMKQVVEKYGGTMKLVAEDGWFSVRIMVPMPR